MCHALFLPGHIKTAYPPGYAHGFTRVDRGLFHTSTPSDGTAIARRETRLKISQQHDFTPDKAKPAKHRSSVEVDELWPAAGAGAVAANESKAPENGDMDCDSDSDLGSRISLHAPM